LSADQAPRRAHGKAFDLAADIANFAASTIASKKRALEQQLADILGAATQCDLARQLQAKIGRARDQLLTFCDYPGDVDATNNGSERKLRPCVIQRKVTNGYRAMWAAQVEADVRTTVDTARLKRKSLPENPRYSGLKPQKPSPKMGVGNYSPGPQSERSRNNSGRCSLAPLSFST
jgi:hypothetical protein